MAKISFENLKMFIVLFGLFLMINNYCGNCYEFQEDEEAAVENEILKRGSGLFPFPRTGRSWRIRYLEQMKRREGLIPFPRVGRRDPSTLKQSYSNDILESQNENAPKESSLEGTWIFLPFAGYNSNSFSKNDLKPEIVGIKEKIATSSADDSINHKLSEY